MTGAEPDQGKLPLSYEWTQGPGKKPFYTIQDQAFPKKQADQYFAIQSDVLQGKTTPAEAAKKMQERRLGLGEELRRAPSVHSAYPRQRLQARRAGRLGVRPAGPARLRRLPRLPGGSSLWFSFTDWDGLSPTTTSSAWTTTRRCRATRWSSRPRSTT